jgi:N-acyl homoserine lactone hydrolase
MNLHAIQTGSFRIKSAQVKGRGLRRRLGVFADPQWTGLLPVYALVIDHPEGVIAGADPRLAVKC